MKKGIKEKHCRHEFMFSVLLGTKCWHIVPHPKKEDKGIIIDYLKEIIKYYKKNHNNSK